MPSRWFVRTSGRGAGFSLRGALAPLRCWRTEGPPQTKVCPTRSVRLVLAFVLAATAATRPHYGGTLRVEIRGSPPGPRRSECPRASSSPPGRPDDAPSSRLTMPHPAAGPSRYGGHSDGTAAARSSSRPRTWEGRRRGTQPDGIAPPVGEPPRLVLIARAADGAGLRTEGHRSACARSTGAGGRSHRHPQCPVAAAG